MIDELFIDKGTTEEGVGYQNDAHKWWVRLTSGAIRPATDAEVELWQIYLGMKDQYHGACKDAWQYYCAGTEQNIETFAGIMSDSPLMDIESHVRELRDHIKTLEQQCAFYRAR